MLGAHPELAIPPESHFLGYLGHRYSRRGWTPATVSSVAADVARDAHFRRWGLDPGGAAARVVASQPSSLAETLGGFFSVYAADEGKRLWGDKTPHYVFILDQLRELWPDMRVIHVIRDGRDVAARIWRWLPTGSAGSPPPRPPPPPGGNPRFRAAAPPAASSASATSRCATRRWWAAPGDHRPSVRLPGHRP